MPHRDALEDGAPSDLSPDLAPIAAELERPDGPEGLGGWLLLVGLGVVTQPLILVVFVFTTFLPVLRDGTWEQLTSPGSPDYTPMFAPLVGFELLTNVVLFVLSVVVLVLFFRKSRRFPTLYVIMVVGSLAVVTLDALLVSWVFPSVDAFDLSTVESIVQEAVRAAIWVPYMYVSDRVKNTFVH